MSRMPGFFVMALAVVLIAGSTPVSCEAGHFTLAFQRQLPAWENSAGTGCLGGHVCRVWIWDENANPVQNIQLKTTWNILMGQTDIDGRAEIPLNMGDDFDLVCTDGAGATSDITRIMTSERPECWGHYSFEVGFLYKTDITNPGEFDLDLHGTWNEPAPAPQDDDAPYTKSLAYNGVDPTDYWSDQTDLGHWQDPPSYFGQTFVATGNRVVAARTHCTIGGNNLLSWKLQIVTFPGLDPVGPVASVPVRWPFGWEAYWPVNANPVVPGQTYMLKVWRDGGMNIWRVKRNVYPNGRYYEGTTAYPDLDLNGHVVCMNYGGGGPAAAGKLDAYYKLDESSGSTAEDSSGNGHNATLSGNPAWQANGGKLGGALLLDGDGDYVEAIGYKGITGQKSRTVAAWIKTDSGAYQDIVGWGAEASGRRWSLVLASGKLGVFVKDGFIFGLHSVADGDWHHVAAVLESDANPDVSEVQLYMDGLAETTSNVGARQIDTGEGDNVKIGTFNDGDDRHFQGLVDEVAIFDVALTEGQIARLCSVGGESFLAGCGRIGVDEEAVLPADINRNCVVDGGDFAILAKAWLESGPGLLCDIVEDESVDYRDVSALSGNWIESIAPLSLDLGLVAHFKLDESAGTSAEECIALKDGTVNGSAWWRPTWGQADGAIELDGSSGYISTDFSIDPAAGALSAAAWIKGGGPGAVIISQTDGEGTGLEWLAAEIGTGALITGIRPPGRVNMPLTSEFVITDSVWHRIVVVWDGAYRSLYVDGTEVARDSLVQGEPMSATGGLNLGAGKTLTPSSFFDGLMDDIRIYNRALAADEASSLAD